MDKEYKKNNITAFICTGRGFFFQMYTGKKSRTSGISGSKEAGATELEPVSFITNGKVVIGRVITSSIHKNQVPFCQRREVTFGCLRDESGGTRVITG